ncbi:MULTISPECIES: cell division protein FtsQ/DivIB [unclassified Herbaspirillum]|jgi:cell division protein FtsQ|uniref:cell division protein FtsQ/DivIB n=1 Tax=unclassified Herbaspirillum TaxID=2624150 RepID=UPI000E2F981C|nr:MULTISPECIES: cell division protein FtsQ/DivIB [unclassified Herbaspirillum]RFB67865.1 cell division protein FtsQ [Herbaspirillum sp. 3R-3a1]TFI06301.1 FtsQ-type POTRA domain-containing protein [Herbaspirillum sp. 3R11]TFI14087.1 FtsQ-type POTRA domain-containing protein [Herbaspirillum sp. 3R-11]TFI27892.1 FtsQ-type POTRA domain-containing protein [Herbaspirillum sp. 3C11]
MWQDVKMLNATTNALLALVALALLASGLWWLAQRPMFTLRTIRVEGVAEEQLRRVNPLTIRASAVPRIKGNFFTADLDAVRAAFESVPWVRKAMVRREWPNKLIVTLEEHRALGTWGDDGRLLSVKGDVFTANLAEAEDDGDLLEFDGPVGSEKEVVARFDQFRNWFAPIKLEPESVALSNRYAWTVKLDNGLTVELGRAESDATLKERIARLVSVYPQLVDRLQGKKIENVDMRYPNGLALKADGLVLAALNGKKK